MVSTYHPAALLRNSQWKRGCWEDMLRSWDDRTMRRLCEQLARSGHYVIRFDNRDTGLSTRLVEGGIPDIGKIIEARMTPGWQVFDRFPRLVRDVARKLGKRVKLRVEGKEIELDRALLDELGDPLMHLLRNAVDHGIAGITRSGDWQGEAGPTAANRIRIVTDPGPRCALRAPAHGRGHDDG